MNNLDIIITILIALPAFFGFRKGFLKSIFSLAGFIAGLILATKYSIELSAYLNFLKIDERVVTIASFILIMVGVYWILSYFAGKLSGINTVTKIFDRIAGMIFGAFKGVIIVSLILIVSTKTFSFIGNESVKSSRLYPLLIDAAPNIYNSLQMVFPGAKTFYEEFEKSVNSIVK